MVNVRCAWQGPSVYSYKQVQALVHSALITKLTAMEERITDPRQATGERTINLQASQSALTHRLV